MRKLFLALIVVAFFSFAFMPEVFAQTSTTTGSGWLNNINGPATIMQSTSGYGNTSLGNIIATIIKMVLSLLGIIFLVLIVFTGYRWMTASGNEEAVTKAKHTLKTSIIGLLIILLAYSITLFIFNQLPMSGSSNAGPTSSGL